MIDGGEYINIVSYGGGANSTALLVGLDEACNHMFLHCGDPIQYARLNTSYWQQHFYAYGRPPYD